MTDISKNAQVPQCDKTAVMQSVMPSELRIGNIIHFPFTAENVTILGINAHNYNSEITHTISFKKEENLYCEKINVLKPINLTEQWLLNFGFILYGKEATDSTSPSDWYFIKKDFRFQIDNISHISSVLGIKIKYVHQLQNLFHSLTGRELTVA